MPLYEYQCDACGHRFEAIRKFSDPPLEQCPKCDGALRKLQSAPAFHLKGTGWYVTDYPKKDQPREETDGKKESDGAAAAAGQTDKSEKSEKGEKVAKTETEKKGEKGSTTAAPPKGNAPTGSQPAP